MVKDVHGASIFGRVGLWIAGRRRLDVLGQKRLAGEGRGVLGHRPVHQVVGQFDDRRLRATRVGHGMRDHTALFQEVTEKVRVGGGKSLIDGLVGIADAHPVAPSPSARGRRAVRTGQQAQDLFLEFAAVLCLVFQDKRPAVAQASQEFFVQTQGHQRQPDQIVKVYAAAIGQAALIVGIDFKSHAHQRQFAGRLAQTEAEGVGVEFHVFGPPDKGSGHVLHQPGPLSALYPLTPWAFQVVSQVAVGQLGMAPHPCFDGVGEDLLRFPLVHDGKVVSQAQQARSLAHDVVGQAVERPHAVANAGQQT